LKIDNVELSNLVGDVSGNLFALTGYGAHNGLVKYGPGSTVPETLLSGVQIIRFTVDARDNIYAIVPSPSGYQIEEFPAGSSTPSNIIGGSNTGLDTQGFEADGITVVP
jgi:hypothetical protein